MVALRKEKNHHGTLLLSSYYHTTSTTYLSVVYVADAVDKENVMIVASNSEYGSLDRLLNTTRLTHKAHNIMIKHAAGTHNVQKQHQKMKKKKKKKEKDKKKRSPAQHITKNLFYYYTPSTRRRFVQHRLAG